LNSSSSRALHPWLIFAGWVFLCSLFFWKPLYSLVQYALNNDNASHILIIPCIVAWLVYQDRQKIGQTTLDLTAASFVAVPAAALAAIIFFSSPADTSLVLAGAILSFILLLISGFIAVFGRNCSKSVWFPMAFLGFLIPFPEPLLDRIIYFLQAGSADVAEALLDWSGVPVLRDGFYFRLPKMSIEVARECSGIRSSIALVILALLVAHFSFSKFWKKVVFVIAGLVMMVVKNGVRIATLTILANYVDPDFLYGRLHKEGGVVFFLIGLVLLLPVYWLLRRGDAQPSLARSEASPT
jgi:exosortase